MCKDFLIERCSRMDHRVPKDSKVGKAGLPPCFLLSAFRPLPTLLPTPTAHCNSPHKTVVHRHRAAVVYDVLQSSSHRECESLLPLALEVRNQASMTTLPERFGTHDRGAFLSGELY